MTPGEWIGFGLAILIIYGVVWVWYEVFKPEPKDDDDDPWYSDFT